MSIAKEVLGGLNTPLIWTNSGKLAVFHAGNSIISCSDININAAWRVSECGAGFYCFLDPGGALFHREGSRSIINIYALDVNRIIESGCYEFKIQEMFSTIDLIKDGSDAKYIVFDIGRSPYVRRHGGQVCFKREGALEFLNDIMQVHRLDFLKDVNVIANDIVDNY